MNRLICILIYRFAYAIMPLGKKCENVSVMAQIESPKVVRPWGIHFRLIAAIVSV